MDDLNSTLSSILGDPNKMDQLRQLAQSLGIDTSGSPMPQGQPMQQDAAQQPQQQAPSGGGGGFDPSAIASMMQAFQNFTGGGGNAAQSAPQQNGGGGMPNMDAISKIAGVMGSMNQNDKNVDLLRSLKPHFSPARAGKIDDAVRIMQLMKAWPALRDSGLLGGLGNLFGGGSR